MSGKFNFFQGQGIVREFCDVSGKNEILQKCQEFYILTWWSWNVWSRCIFFAKFIKFSAPILSGKFELVSGKCQGILVSPKCMNNNHIENILKSASKVIGIMRKLKYTFSRVALNQIYLSYLLPIIEYSCVVWDGCTERDIESLQKRQNEAARIVTGLTRSVSLNNLYKRMGGCHLSKDRSSRNLSSRVNQLMVLFLHMCLI